MPPWPISPTNPPHIEFLYNPLSLPDGSWNIFHFFNNVFYCTQFYGFDCLVSMLLIVAAMKEGQKEEAQS